MVSVIGVCVCLVVWVPPNGRCNMCVCVCVYMCIDLGVMISLYWSFCTRAPSPVRPMGITRLSMSKELSPRRLRKGCQHTHTGIYINILYIHSLYDQNSIEKATHRDAHIKSCAKTKGICLNTFLCFCIRVAFLLKLFRYFWFAECCLLIDK